MTFKWSWNKKRNKEQELVNEKEVLDYKQLSKKILDENSTILGHRNSTILVTLITFEWITKIRLKRRYKEGKNKEK